MSEKRKEGGSKWNGRPLGFQETFLHTYAKDYGAAIVMQFNVIQSTTVIEEEHIRTACQSLARRQEALQMRIVKTGEDGGYSFKPMENPINVKLSVTRLNNSKSWPALASQDLYNIFDFTEGPLWDVVFAQVEETTEPASRDHPYEYVIIFRFHHGMADAKSSFDLVYRQFLPILSAVMNDGDFENIIPYLAMCKPNEEYFLTPAQLRNPVPWILKFILGIVRWKTRTFGPSPTPRLIFPGDPEPTDGDFSKIIGCFPLVVSEELTRALLSSGREHGVTVHTVLLVMSGIAICRAADEAGVHLPTSFLHNWPIDTRKFLNIQSPQPLGSLNAGGMTFTKRKTDYTDSEFWQMCSTVHKGVKTQALQEKCTAGLGVVEYFNMASRGGSLPEVVREVGFSSICTLSNAGNCDAGPQPKMTEGKTKIQLTEQFFTVSGSEILDSALLYVSVTCFNRKLMLNCTINREHVSQRFAERYLDHLEQCIRCYSHDGSPV